MLLNCFGIERRLKTTEVNIIEGNKRNHIKEQLKKSNISELKDMLHKNKKLKATEVIHSSMLFQNVYKDKKLAYEAILDLYNTSTYREKLLLNSLSLLLINQMKTGNQMDIVVSENNDLSVLISSFPKLSDAKSCYFQKENTVYIANPSEKKQFKNELLKQALFVLDKNIIKSGFIEKNIGNHSCKTYIESLNKNVFAKVEKYFKSNVLNYKVYIPTDLDEKLKVLKAYQKMEANPEEYLFKNIIDKPCDDVFKKNIYCQKDEQQKFVNDVINRLLKSKDNRIQALIEFLTISSKDKNLRIFFGDSISDLIDEKYKSVKGLYRTGNENNPKVGCGEGIPRIFVSVGKKIDGGFSVNKTSRFLLHEAIHHVISILDYPSKEKMIRDIEPLIRINFNPFRRKNKDGEVEKAIKYVDKEIINRIVINNRSYDKVESACEEMVCDAFRLMQYMERHPSRAQAVNKRLGSVFDFIDNEMMPKLLEYIEAKTL